VAKCPFFVFVLQAIFKLTNASRICAFPVLRADLQTILWWKNEQVKPDYAVTGWREAFRIDVEDIWRRGWMCYGTRVCAILAIRDLSNKDIFKQLKGQQSQPFVPRYNSIWRILFRHVMAVWPIKCVVYKLSIGLKLPVLFSLDSWEYYEGFALLFGYIFLKWKADPCPQTAHLRTRSQMLKSVTAVNCNQLCQDADDFISFTYKSSLKSYLFNDIFVSEV
jgi:hypothetical protein